MSWNVEIRAWFKHEQLPTQRFIGFTKHLGKSSFFSGLGRVRIYKFNFRREEIARFESPYAKAFSVEQVRDILQSYDEQGIVLEGLWGVNSHFFDYSNSYTNGKQKHEPSRKLIEDKWQLIITIFSKDYKPIYYPSGLGMVCNIGKQHYYSQKISKQKELAHLNILAALHELSVLSELDVSTMYGLNINDNPDPRTFYLVYHSDPNDFRKDMSLWTQHLTLEVRNLTHEDIILAVSDCNNIEYLETREGIFVFHQDLVDGNLSEFYTAVFKLLGVESLD